MKLSLRLCLPLLVVAPLIALAQPQKPSPPKAVSAATDSDDDRVYLSNAPDGNATYDDDRKIARVTKNVVITQKGQNLTVYAQEAVYDQNQNKAKATGKLRVVTRDSTIIGQRLDADFDTHQFTISGNVIITSHGKKDGKVGELGGETKKKPIKVYCDQVVWEYDTRQATATGSIRIVQDTNKGTCNSIFYDEQDNVVTLRGNVKFGDDKERTFSGKEVVVYLDQNVTSTDSGVRLAFPKRDGVGGSTGKTPQPTKTRVPIKAASKISDDPLGKAPLAPTLAPTATEEPTPTPFPDEDNPAANTDAKP